MKKYARLDAKAYAREHLKGVWAATLTPSQTRPVSVVWNGWSTSVSHGIMRRIPATPSASTSHVR